MRTTLCILDYSVNYDINCGLQLMEFQTDDQLKAYKFQQQYQLFSERR